MNTSTTLSTVGGDAGNRSFWTAVQVLVASAIVELLGKTGLEMNVERRIMAMTIASGIVSGLTTYLRHRFGTLFVITEGHVRTDSMYPGEDRLDD